jgi:hypothetical protein
MSIRWSSLIIVRVSQVYHPPLKSLKVATLLEGIPDLKVLSSIIRTSISIMTRLPLEEGILEFDHIENLQERSYN